MSLQVIRDFDFLELYQLVYKNNISNLLFPKPNKKLINILFKYCTPKNEYIVQLFNLIKKKFNKHLVKKKNNYYETSEHSITKYYKYIYNASITINYLYSMKDSTHFCCQLSLSSCSPLKTIIRKIYRFGNMFFVWKRLYDTSKQKQARYSNKNKIFGS